MLPAAAGASSVYVNNSDGTDGTVSVIDTTTNTVVGTPIKVGNGPRGVAVTPYGKSVYVTNGGDNTVSVIDTTTNTVTKTITVGNRPWEVAVTPNGDSVYVTNLGGNTVSVIDTTTNTVTKTIRVGLGPGGVAVTPDGESVYVANYSGGTVSVIDTATKTVTGTITVGNEPFGVAVTPDGKHVYVTNSGNDAVSVIDTFNKGTKTITVGLGPGGVAVTPNGKHVYVTNENDGTVSVIDSATNAVTKTITVGNSPIGVAVSPNGNSVYVTNQGNNTVSVIDTTKNTVTKTITVGESPTGVAAQAKPVWSTPGYISDPGQDAEYPQVAFDGSGNAIAVWYRSAGSNGNQKGRLQASVRPASTSVSSAHWLKAQTLSLDVPYPMGIGGPQVAVDESGKTVAVWLVSDGSHNRVRASVRPTITGLWSTPVDLSEAGEDAEFPQVAFDWSGNAIAVWRRNDVSNWRVQASVRPASTGVWGPVETLSAAGQNADYPQVAFEGSGNAIVVWERGDAPDRRVQASVRPASTGVWSTPETLSAAGQDAWNPDIASGAGATIVVWTRSPDQDGGNGPHRVQASVRDSFTGVWSTPENLSAESSDIGSAQVAVDPTGTAVAVWFFSVGRSGGIVMQASVRTGASWSTPVDLSAPSDDVARPQVAVDSSGNAIAAVWEEVSDGSDRQVRASVRPASTGVWGPVETLSAAGQNAWNPQIAFGTQGQGIAVWTRSDGTNDRILVSVFDGASLAGIELSSAYTRAAKSRKATRNPVSRWIGPKHRYLKVKAKNGPVAHVTKITGVIKVAGERFRLAPRWVKLQAGEAKVVKVRFKGHKRAVKQIRKLLTDTPGRARVLIRASSIGNAPPITDTHWVRLQH